MVQMISVFYRWIFIFVSLGLSFSFSLQAKQQLRFESLNLRDGLSQSSVHDVVQDKDGFMWFATADGLNRYDGYDFKVFRHDSTSSSISSNFIKVLFIDSQQRLWVGTNGGGVNLYLPKNQSFMRFMHKEVINAIYEDSLGHLWFGTEQGLFRFEFDAQRFTSLSVHRQRITDITEDSQNVLWFSRDKGVEAVETDSYLPVSKPKYQDILDYLAQEQVSAILNDSQGDVWFGTYSNGLVRFTPKTGAIEHFTHLQIGFGHLTDSQIRTLYEDKLGGIWIGTESGGVNYFDKQTQQFSAYSHSIQDKYSLSNDTVLAIYQDAGGMMWFGTWAGGVNRYLQRWGAYSHYRVDGKDDGLSHSVVTDFIKDDDGKLWVSTYGGGLNLYNEMTERFTHFRHQANQVNGISDDRIWSLYQDENKDIWIGTYGSGLDKLEPKTGEFKNFRHDSSDPQSISHDDVVSTLVDSKGRFWVATRGGGLNLLDRQTGKFKHYRYDVRNRHSIGSDKVWTILEDSAGNIWLGLDGAGVDKFDVENGRFEHFIHLEDQNSLSDNIVTSIVEYPQGILWMGTKGGLNRFDVKTGVFEQFKEEDGLSNNVVYDIVPDNGQLWLSTNRGLSRLDIATKVFRNFSVSDGLQGNEFNTGAYFKAKSGEIFFGGTQGFNRFFPADIVEDTQAPNVVLSDLLLFNQTVMIDPKVKRDSEVFYLKQDINHTDTITLNHEQSMVSFVFSALSFANPKKNQFAYQLENWDDNWIYTNADRRIATYSKLDAGEYIFRVKASNADGLWNEQGKSIRLNVLPPPWLTWWAYVGYGLLVLLIGYFLIRAQYNKIYYERSLVKKLKAMDRIKDEFLANTSHELRTPLNGIIGLTESLMDGIAGELPPTAKQNLAMVVASGRRLSNLVNDILDFSKLKNHGLSLNIRPVDLHSMTTVIFTLSRSLIGAKKIELINDIDVNFPAVNADEDRLQQILHNLIGNGIKFTESGAVKVSARVNDGDVEVVIEDTGIGIAEDKLGLIFASFEQADGGATRQYGGTGLGLAVTKQLVELHGGYIAVESGLGVGSKFTFSLSSCGKQVQSYDAGQLSVSSLYHLPEDEMGEEGDVDEPNSAVDARGEANRDDNVNESGSFNILLVDDEPINLQVLHNHLLLQDYHIIEASSGEKALQLLEQDESFDLVLLDIMMPKVSGYQVCEKIRERYSINDLPVIFLTAKTQVNDLVRSFEVGANDYLSKPVAKHELLSRVETHLRLLDVNRNLEQKVAQRTQELVQAEKMVSLGTLTAGVAHELNNPTNFAYLATQSLANDLELFERFIANLAGDDADEAVTRAFSMRFNTLRGHLKTIIEGAERIKKTVQDLRFFTQLDGADVKKIDIRQSLQTTVDLVRTQHQEVVRFELDLADMKELMCSVAQLNQVFISLVLNACDAVKIRLNDEPKIEGVVSIVCKEVEQSIEIKITDNGCGMDEDTLTKLFEPFFTTKEIGSGTGLGLSTAYGIIKRHHGEFEVSSSLGQGSEFTITLPYDNQMS